MNIKLRLTLTIGILVTMIVLLVALSVVNLQILTATHPDSPAAEAGLNRALVLIASVGSLCILIGTTILWKIPASVSKPIQQITDGIQQIANHNYEVRLDLKGSPELIEANNNFNRMAKRLSDYHNSTLSDLMASKKYMETIIDSISEPIIGLDNQMNILFINNEALNVLNLEGEKVLHKSARDIALCNDQLRRIIREIPQNLDNTENTESIKKKNTPIKIYSDNKECYFQVKYMSIVRADASEKTMIKNGDVIMLKNITEFQELDSAKTTFLSTISHQLKTPISAILMCQQLLDDKRIGMLNPEQKELAETIKDNSDRLLTITDELLNMTQVESGKLQLKPKITKPIELIEYAIKANRVQAEKFNIQIELDYPEEGQIGKLFVDSEKIAWVLSNLLSNAIRYSSENGRVIIGARNVKQQIEMFVQDFGKGIAPRYHQSIFDHYFRVPGTKVQGTGLGLSISKDFVEAHNGMIEIESELGKGSIFRIRLSN